MELQKVSVSISENQFDKLRRGKPIQLSKEKLKNGNHVLYVNPSLAKEIRKARNANKGLRIQLTQQELEMSAEGLKEFLKKAGVFYNKHIKSTVSPYIKKGLNQLANVALTEAEAILPVAQPYLEKGRKYIPQAIDKVGDITGAYGMKGGMPVIHCGGCDGCRKGNKTMKAGSFKPAGNGIKKSGKIVF